MKRWCCGMLVAWAVGGCNDDPFDTSAYSRVCAMASDCVVVYSGDPCGCGCEQTAIAASEMSRYSADRRDYIDDNCSDDVPACKECPAPPNAACTQGSCALAP